MIDRIEPAAFLKLRQTYPVIDVRSPSEHLQGHIPGSFNLPLFDDQERAVIGKLYHDAGRDASVLKGLEIVGPNMAGFVKQSMSIASQKTVLMHCWRGGMRSEKMAWLLSTAGFRVFLLNGGYKAYRRYIRDSFEKEVKYIILAGKTGSGKTEILEVFRNTGQQVLNLEQLACHKGSAFGGIGMGTQPSNEQFENDLFDAWIRLDHTLPVWLEDESLNIGKVTIPDPLFRRMSNAVTVETDLPAAYRVQRLLQEYACFPPEILVEALRKITRRMGGDLTTEAIGAIHDGDLSKAISIVLGYYDKTYAHSTGKRDPGSLHTIPLHTADASQNAKTILNYCQTAGLI